VCNQLVTFLDTNTLKSIDFNHEVVLEEDKTDDGEKIDEDKRKHCSQQDRTAVLGHRTYHIEQRLLLVDNVQQLSTIHHMQLHDIAEFYTPQTIGQLGDRLSQQQAALLPTTKQQ